MLLLGDRSWIVGAFGAVLGLGCVFVAALYVVHLRSSLERFRRMRVKQATLEADAQKVVLTSDAGTSELKWSAVGDVWRFERFWLLFLSRAQFVTLPVADLSAETQALLVERVQSHGGKVV